MALKQLLELKKQTLATKHKLYKQHLVVGEDLFCLCLYHYLKEKWGNERVALLCKHPLTKNDIYPLGPNTLRGSANIKEMARPFPTLEWNEETKPALFLKELKWHPFGGKVKPCKLLEDEIFFTWPKAEFDVEKLYPFLKENAFFESLAHQCLTFSLNNITSGERPYDLVEPIHFILDCADNICIGCEYLYWGRHPKAFIDLYQNQTQFGDKLIQFYQSLNPPSALYICFQFERPITDLSETLFIPLSYTYGRGHFVGEFKTSNEGHQTAEFMVYLDFEQTSEEQISARIRFIKRNLNKIFKNFSSTPYKTFVKLKSHLASLKMNDPLFQEAWANFPNLSMVSSNAPLKNHSGLDELSFFARGALSLNQTISTCLA